MNIKEASEKIKGATTKKKMQYIAIALIIAVILLIYLSSFAQKRGEDTQKQKNTGLNDGIEEKMEEVLSKMEGVGDVSVVINYASTSELVPAVSTEMISDEENKVSQSEEVVSVSGDALIIKENLPEIRGVIVVAEGAQDIGVRMNLLSAVTTLLGVTVDCVEILY